MAALVSQLRARARRAPGWAPAALVVGLGWIVFVLWGVRTGTHQSDEAQYVWLARYVDGDFPGALVNFSNYLRGLQRLEVWMLSVPLAVLSAPGALVVGRALNAAAFASTAIPVALLARRLGVARGWAWTAGALTIAVPWAVVTTAFLTENLALPAFAWFVLAAWLMLVQGGPRADAIAVAAVVVAGLARTSLLFLAVALPVAVLWQGLRCGEATTGSRLRTIATRHALLWGAIAAALIAVALSATGVLPPLRKLGGLYGGAYGSDPWLIVERCGFMLSRLAVGTGFLPLGLALAWGTRQIVRPTDPRTHALALVAAGAALCVLVPTAGFTIGNPSIFEERYLVYLAPLPALAAAVALARGELEPWMAAAGVAVVALLLALAGWSLVPLPYDAFTNPAMRFYAHDLHGGSLVIPLLVLAAGGTVAWALHTLRGARAAQALLVAVAALGVLGLVQVQSTLRAYENGPGQRHGPSLAQRAWVDQAIYGKGRALLFGEGLANTPGFDQTWAEVQFWNTSVTGSAPTLGAGSISTPPGDRDVPVSIDEATGRLVTPGPLTRYLVTTTGDQIGLRATTVATSSHLPLRLLRLQGRPQALYALRDLQFDGWATAGEPATVRVYPPARPAGSPAVCVAFTLTPPPGLAATTPATVTGPGVRRSLRLEPGHDAPVSVRLAAATLRSDHADLVVRSDAAGTLPDGRGVGPHLALAHVGRCTSSG